MISILYIRYRSWFFWGCHELAYFFSSFLRISSYLRKESLMENFIFCAVKVALNSIEAGEVLVKNTWCKILQDTVFYRTTIFPRMDWISTYMEGTEKYTEQIKHIYLKEFMKLFQMLPKAVFQSKHFFPKLTVKLFTMHCFSNIFKHLRVVVS